MFSIWSFSCACFISGVCYAQEFGEYEKGIDYFQAAVDSRPDYEFGGVAYSLIARYTKKLKDSGAIAEAEADARIKEAYQAVVESWPDCRWVETALLELGRMCFAEGEIVDAIMYYEMLLDRSAEKVCLVGNDLIAGYTEMGDVEMAEQVRAELTKRGCPGM
ncbi:MAG TPA: tetratricopeptide repeat protein [Planctomycetes bacterium]|nr:tetratricopeptide repeat protein [Planctomycetota bacterium]